MRRRNDHLYQAAEGDRLHRTAVLQGMKYIDLHTDALTGEGVLSVTPETLRRGDCALECFACFTPHGTLCDTLRLCDRFDEMCSSCGYKRVERADGLSADGIHAMLTVEGGEAVEGELENLTLLYKRGVRLLTLVWNFDNNLGGTHGGGQGLTPFGRAVVEKMGELKMLVDVSHGSDALFYDVAKWSRERGLPFVASHSNARAVCAHSRNLTDEEIGTLADCGGVMGLNFYDEFLSSDKSAEGQKIALIAQISHILKVGGEDVLALGSDFDGIPQNAYLKTAADMPRFFEDLCAVFPPRLVEKLAYANAARVIREIIN